MSQLINISNYEEFVMDYIDGTLDVIDRAHFEAFLLKHPEVALEARSRAAVAAAPPWTSSNRDASTYDSTEPSPSQEARAGLPETEDSSCITPGARRCFTPPAFGTMQLDASVKSTDARNEMCARCTGRPRRRA